MVLLDCPNMHEDQQEEQSPGITDYSELNSCNYVMQIL
jgi:hypothetical protein